MTTSSRICPACQTNNPPQAAFCFGCGKPLGQVSTTPELLHQRYHQLHRLGEGGFGAVYRAEDIQLGESPLYHLATRQPEISAVAWSPDGTRIASGGTNNEIQVWSAL
jgi:WD40 repeat protein